MANSVLSLIFPLHDVKKLDFNEANLFDDERVNSFNYLENAKKLPFKRSLILFGENNMCDF